MIMQHFEKPFLIGQGAELRASSRFRLSMECAVFGAGTPLRGVRMQTIDIGKGGVSLDWRSESHPPAVGEPLIIEIDLPGNPIFGSRAMVFETKVVRVDHAPDGQILVATHAQKSGFRDSMCVPAGYALN